MIFSFPIGAFIMFNSEIGQEINFEFPLGGVGFFGNFSDETPFDIVPFFLKF